MSLHWLSVPMWFQSNLNNHWIVTYDFINLYKSPHSLFYNLIFIVAASEMVSEHCCIKALANNQLRVRLWPIQSLALDVQLYSIAAKLLIVMKQDPCVGFGKLLPKGHLLFYSFILRYWIHYSFKGSPLFSNYLNLEHIVCSIKLRVNIKMMWIWSS